MCGNVLSLYTAQVQELEDDEREHDGEYIVLLGERGHSGDSGWEYLEEDIDEEGSEEREGSPGDTGRRSANEGYENCGGPVVTPRNKRTRIEEEVARELEATDDYDDDDDSGKEKFGF